MSEERPQQLLNAIEALGKIHELTVVPAEIRATRPPAVEAALIRGKTGRVRELAGMIGEQLDELAQLAFEGEIDSDYRSIGDTSAAPMNGVQHVP